MIAYFYKTTFDISLFFALSSFFIRFFRDYDKEGSLYAFALLLAAGLLFALAERFARVGGALRLLALCLPGIAFLWQRDAVEIMQFVLPWVYIAAGVLFRRYDVYYKNFKDLFRSVLFVFLFPFLMLFYDAGRGIPALREAAPYAVVFFTSGVMLLQVLRWRGRTEDSRLFGRHQLWQMFAFFVLCTAVTAGRIFDFAKNILWEKMLWPAILFLIGSVWSIAQWLWVRKPPELRNPGSLPQAESFDGPMPTAGAEVFEEVVQEVEQAAGPPVDFAPLFAAAGVAAAVFLFFFLRGNVRQKRKAAVVFEEREELEEKQSGRPVRLKKHSSDPAVEVRYQYRRFMRKTDAGKGRLKNSDTTEKIREKYICTCTGKTESTEKRTEEINEIYRQTRYGSGKTGRREAGRMRELMKSIR